MEVGRAAHSYHKGAVGQVVEWPGAPRETSPDLEAFLVFALDMRGCGREEWDINTKNRDNDDNDINILKVKLSVLRPLRQAQRQLLPYESNSWQHFT